MEKNGGNGEIGCIGCGLWRLVVEENGRKGVQTGTECPFFTVPVSRFFRRSDPQFPLKKSIHCTHRRKNGIFCHPPTLTATAASADA